MIKLAVLAILFSASASPQAVRHRAAGPAGPVAVSPAAQRAIDDFERTIAPLRARFAAIPADASVAANIAERVAVEQGMRKFLPDPTSLGLSPDDRKAAMSRIYGAVAEVDIASTAYLKSVLPADGWFRKNRDGEATTSGAWLIVQHSQDQDFQRAVLARMKSLAETGEVKGADYALLYDRLETFAGRPQYYGSQYRCEKNRWVMAPTRDADSVDARRAALGMFSTAENLKRISANGGC